MMKLKNALLALLVFIALSLVWYCFSSRHQSEGAEILKVSSAVTNHRANIIWIDNNTVKFKQFYKQEWHEEEIVHESAISTNYSASVGAGLNNQTIAIWSSESQDSMNLKYSVRAKDGGWSESKLLTDQNGENLSSEVIFDLSNKCWVFWVSDQDGDDDIYVSSWMGAEWLPPQKVNIENDVPDISPKAYIEDNGFVTVAWRSYDKSKFGYIVKSHTFETSGSDQTTKNGGETRLDDIKLHTLDLPITKIYVQFPNNRSQQSTTIDTW